MKLNINQAARAKLIDGRELEGKIRFIAATSNPNTRTFRIEIVADNPDGTWVEGVTTKVTTSLPAQSAHRISPSILVLDREGRVGLRIVTTAGRADFAPVEIIGAKNGWIYVAGLNDTQQIIVVGQDFVENGQEVDPVLLDLSASGAKS